MVGKFFETGLHEDATLIEDWKKTSDYYDQDLC